MLKWFNVYRHEIGLLIWVTTLALLIRSASASFNHFAETTFLKRFGVEYLPWAYLINALSGFFSMALLTGLLGRISVSRLLTFTLFFCGFSATALRWVIPLGYELLYPVMFIMKAQYELMLGVLFWNLANDLFSARQSKRLFPLITAGGIIGVTAGSFATPSLAAAIRIDNLLFVYFLLTAAAGATLVLMESLFQSQVFRIQEQKRDFKTLSFIEQWKKLPEIIRGSKLILFFMLLFVLPNITLPILNYQFRFIVDRSYATEFKLLEFLSYFWGVMNGISLMFLPFVGRLYSRWGLPAALLFHPANYVITFLALLLRFDIFIAVYARVSTSIIRTVLHKPARTSLLGLLPGAHRDIIRPFLRGTMVRIGLLTGSGIIIVSEGFVHPRYLSVIAVLLTAAWLIISWLLRKRYPDILLNMISKRVNDTELADPSEDLAKIKDRRARTQFFRTLLNSDDTQVLNGTHIENESDLRQVLALLDDPSNPVHEQAKLKVQKAPHVGTRVLLENLASRRQRTREGILFLLEFLDDKNLDITAFIKTESRICYRLLAEVRALMELRQTPERDLLIEHLNQERKQRIDTVLRVLAARDHSGRMHLIRRGIHSLNERLRSDSLEAFDVTTTKKISRILIPLIEDVAPARALKAGKKHFKLPKLDSDKGKLYAGLLKKEDTLAQALSLALIAKEREPFKIKPELLDRLRQSPDIHVRRLADRHETVGKPERDIDPYIAKLIHLSKVGAFKGLSIIHLAALACVAKVVTYPPGRLILQDEATCDTLYVLVEGEVTAVGQTGASRSLQGGNVFGEAAFLDKAPVSETFLTVCSSRIIEVHSDQFRKTAEKYPEVALQLCGLFFAEIRKLNEMRDDRVNAIPSPSPLNTG